SAERTTIWTSSMSTYGATDSQAITEHGRAVSWRRRLRRPAAGDWQESGDMQTSTTPPSSTGQLTLPMAARPPRVSTAISHGLSATIRRTHGSEIIRATAEQQ